MQSYINDVKDILENGVVKHSRAGETLSVFGRMKRYDISNGKLPIITTKKIFHDSIIRELECFINGDTTINHLIEHDVHFWDDFVDKSLSVYLDTSAHKLYTEKELRAIKRAMLLKIKFKKNHDFKHGYIAGTVEGWENATEKENNEIITGIQLVLGREEVLLHGECGKGFYGEKWRKDPDYYFNSHGYDHDYLTALGYSPVQGTPGLWLRYIDQLGDCVNLLRNDPDSRRIIVNSYDNRSNGLVTLACCQSLFQFYSVERSSSELLHDLVSKGYVEADINGFESEQIKDLCKENGIKLRKLSILLFMRSNDAPVGEPFNMTQYAAVCHLMAHITDHVTDELVYVPGDYHVYKSSIEGLLEQMERDPLPQTTTISFSSDIKELDDLVHGQVTIDGYVSHASIPLKVEVGQLSK